MDIEPGRALFYVAEWERPPRDAVPFHHTDTVDLGLVLTGAVFLILDDGEHRLNAGDCFALHGIDHSWRVAPEGCRICSMSVGTPPLH